MNALERSVVDSTAFFANETSLEQHLWATESLNLNSDDVPTKDHVGLMYVKTIRRGVQLSIVDVSESVWSAGLVTQWSWDELVPEGGLQLW